jgi:outer membrane protein OmpA-like peptidoglycan-associated protein
MRPRTFVLAGVLASVASAAAAHEYLIYYPPGVVEAPERYRPQVADVVIRCQGAVARVLVRTHTDRVGTVEANLKLSEARAEHMSNLLQAHGVSPRAIVLVPRGEAEPAVPTQDEVAEPLNHRTTLDVICGS